MRPEHGARSRWRWTRLFFALSLACVTSLVRPAFAENVSPVSAPDEGALLRDVPFNYNTATYEHNTTAAKYEQTIAQAPSAVSIVTSDDIRHFGYRTLADILRCVRGFYTSYDRNYTYLGVRGFSRPGDYNSRILVMIDGHRLNDNVYDSALIGTEFPLDVDLIDRVEIARGPGSSLYGNNAFFAVVNIITRRGRELKAAEASTSAGDLNTYTGRLTVGRRFQNGFEGIVSGSYLTSEGHRRLHFSEFDAPETNNGVAVGTDGDEAYKLFTTMSYRDLTIQALHGSRTKNVPTGSFDTDFNDARYRTTDQLGYLDVKYERALDADWRVMGRTYYDWYSYWGDYPFSGIINKDKAQGDRLGGEVQLLTRALSRNVLTGGVQVDYSPTQDQVNYDVGPYALRLDARHQSAHWGIYAQDEITLLPNLLLNAGIRYDSYEDFDGSTNPRVALIYNPLRDTTLKAVYGTAFRTPNVYERFYADGMTQKANPSLEPERISTYELIAEQSLWGWLHATVAPFYYDIRNLINQETDPSDGLLVFRNLGHVTSRGVEAELAAMWSSGWSARMAYTFQQSRDEAADRALSDSPHHLVQFNLVAPLLRDKLFTGLEVQYVGDRTTRNGNTVGGRVVTNVTLFSTSLLLQHLDLSVTVYNLFNVKYENPVSDAFRQQAIRQDGTGFRVKLTYSY